MSRRWAGERGKGPAGWLLLLTYFLPSFLPSLQHYPHLREGDGVLIKVRHLLWRFWSCCWSRGWCAFLLTPPPATSSFEHTSLSPLFAHSKLLRLSLSLYCKSALPSFYFISFYCRIFSLAFAFCSSSVFTVVPSEEWFDWSSVLPPFLFNEEFFSTSLLQCQRVYNLLLHAWIWRIH